MTIRIETIAVIEEEFTVKLAGSEIMLSDTILSDSVFRQLPEAVEQLKRYAEKDD